MPGQSGIIPDLKGADMSPATITIIDRLSRKGLHSESRHMEALAKELDAFRAAQEAVEEKSKPDPDQFKSGVVPHPEGATVTTRKPSRSKKA